MALSNNDYNWRLVAAVAIPANTAVIINAQGKAAPSDGTYAVGFVVQAVAAGDRAPIIRGGTLSELTGFSAGARLRPNASGALVTTGTNPILAVVKSEDTTTAVILTGNLDDGIS